MQLWRLTSVILWMCVQYAAVFVAVLILICLAPSSRMHVDSGRPVQVPAPAPLSSPVPPEVSR